MHQASPGTAGPGPDDEPVLITLARAGDREAFGALYDECRPFVFHFVLGRVGGDLRLAEDLTSETFLRALRRIDTFTWQGRDFRAWLVTIARNLVADHYKSGRFRREVSTADPVEDRSVPSTEDTVLDSLSGHAVRVALVRLNADQRRVVTLRFLHGLTVAETSVAMDRSASAVKSMQHRAMRRLLFCVPAELAVAA
ncbi:sigma-70 family RNA polymerase sigma factor [Streptomyces sp. NPDC006733]|uniref:sigma-70 family RNA polymerase sigma factor n=1 Tax=Streptomyces sp. NPDC006733 TaxID=3155460 RepID=UPI0033EC8C47